MQFSVYTLDCRVSSLFLSQYTELPRPLGSCEKIYLYKLQLCEIRLFLDWRFM